MHRQKFVLIGLVLLPVAILGLQRELPTEVKVRQITSMVNLKSLATAINMYAGDADDIYPNVRNLKSLKVVTYPYVKVREYWKPVNPQAEIRWNSVLNGVSTKDVVEPDSVVMFYESKPWPDNRRAVAFANGAATLLRPQDWAHTAMSLLKSFPKSAKPLPESLGASWRDAGG